MLALAQLKENEAALLAETNEAAVREAEWEAKLAQRADAYKAQYKAKQEQHAVDMAKLEARAAVDDGGPAAKGLKRMNHVGPTVPTGSGLFDGLLSGVNSFIQLAGAEPMAIASSTAAAEPLTKEEKLAELRAQYKAADRKVHDLRATGGVPLQTAYEELKLLKPRYKAMRDEMEKSKRAASGSAAGGRSSAASQLSARRLERQREREALRKQPKPWQ